MSVYHPRPVYDPVVTLISRPVVTREGREAMKKFYDAGGNLQKRDSFPTHAELIEFAGRKCYHANGRKNPGTATSEGYLGNLMDQRHWSPTEHGSYTFLIEDVSRALTHELVRHRHGSFSQESQRYVKAVKDPAFVVPPALRDKMFTGDDIANARERRSGANVYSDNLNDWLQTMSNSLDEYDADYFRLRESGLDHKQASEAARSWLPNAMATDIVVTFNARSLMEFIEKRDADGADEEIREVAQIIGDTMMWEIPEMFSPAARYRWSGDNEQKGVKK